MKMIDHNHFICHLILGTFTEYPDLQKKRKRRIGLMRLFLFLVCYATVIPECMNDLPVS